MQNIEISVSGTQNPEIPIFGVQNIDIFDIQNVEISKI